jgi:hypothetical protein
VDARRKYRSIRRQPVSHKKKEATGSGERAGRAIPVLGDQWRKETGIVVSLFLNSKLLGTMLLHA